MLPVRLCAALADEFEAVAHVRPLGLDRASDAPVFAFARERGLTLVTKDADFQTLLALHGPPPRWCGSGWATRPPPPWRPACAATPPPSGSSTWTRAPAL